MRANNLYALLVIQIGPDDFMQLTADASGVQIDFPLITPRQRAFEAKIREVASGEKLEVVENSGSDGSRFLDMNVNGESGKVAAVCSRVLRQVFSVSGDIELIFQHVGLADGDAT
ncbi:MAG TPA: hypothetical protein VFU37_19145 [Pyrinomonadaceae bacterium]|nr:hypothetical protein [Pyrinomonadaceae bacterium]